MGEVKHPSDIADTISAKSIELFHFAPCGQRIFFGDLQSAMVQVSCFSNNPAFQKATPLLMVRQSL
jgi:hypothetical protein